MKRIIASLVASVAFLAFAAPSFAASPMPMSSMSSMKGSSMKSSSMKSSTMASSKMTCPSGMSMVSGYKKKDGTMVKAYCRKSK
jgi:hypothetical protein